MEYGKDICPLCEKPYATDDDYDKYNEGEGEHLCWNCWHADNLEGISDCSNYDAQIYSKLLELLNERDGLAKALREIASLPPCVVQGKNIMEIAQFALSAHDSLKEE